MKISILNTSIILFTMVLITHGKAQTISADFPFESRFATINGNKLHYIESGPSSGGTILFLHGVPMSTYSWRNIIPHLSGSSRCIAIDFMGFGKSDKPEITYSLDNQYDYLDEFISSLGLKDITLVMTDIGGIAGQKYARLHPENVKAMVFMETPIGDAQTFHKNGGMMQHMLFGMAAKDKLGYNMFVKKNMFTKMMPQLIKRKLSKEEKAIYAAPFKAELSRVPLFKLPNAFPKKGENPTPGDMADYLNKNDIWLRSSEHPKLLITASPGMLITKKALEYVNSNIQNVAMINVGKAKHLMEEDLPHEIGEAIKKWYMSIN